MATTKINKQTIKIRNKSYPVTISGKGAPIISIGLGSLGLRTLSDRFKQSFKVYASDLYWDKRYALDDPQSLTMDQIIDDIAELAKELGLKSFFLFGHSAWGLVALEFAKKYPELVDGIILSGTPVNSNPEVERINNLYFEQHADAKRKMIDAQRREQIAKEDLSSLTSSERFLKEYVWKSAPRYWHIPDYDCSDIWEDIIVDDVLGHLFSEILPNIDVTKNLGSVDCPIFLAAGDSDFDCCPFMWDDVENKPKNMILRQFKESGHWPHYEEHSSFDSRIEDWLKTQE